MAGIKSLAKETVIYGVSSILGRFLNWCLVPLYVYMFPTEEYGVVSYLYSFTAVLLVILNYGMETGFFRFANKEKDPNLVYSSSLICVGSTSLLFIALLSILLKPVSNVILLPEKSLFVWLLGVTVAIDAFSNLPFAYLRFKKKALRFALIKMLNVGINIGLNLFFLLLCPKLANNNPGLISWFYEPLGGEAFGIGWIFVSNIISSSLVLVMLIPELRGFKYSVSGALLKKMLSYSWPLLILGIAGILSQNMGQMMIPYLFIGEEEAARSMVGIYGANIKIAIVMVMFIQAFRYAYEPFIFSKAEKKGESKNKEYGDAMKFYIIFGLLIFLGVMFFLPILKYFISESYWPGLDVVPLMMAAEFCFGVFYNLSVWYKLTDRTQWGMYFSLICFVMMLLLNVWLVRSIGIPRGYMGSAWAALISYFIITVVSYFVGQKYYPISYPIKRIACYIVFAGTLFVIGSVIAGVVPMREVYLIRILLLLAYVFVIARLELKRKFAKS